MFFLFAILVGWSCRCGLSIVGMPFSGHDLHSTALLLRKEIARRGFLLGISLPAGVAGATSHGTTKEVDVCGCCELDWCACGRAGCDCLAHLKELGYTVPLDARTAYALAGDAWADALGWSSASFWHPILDDKVELRSSSISGVGTGLFARASLPSGAVLPPYQGLVLTIADLTRSEYSSSQGNYVWCPRSSQRLLEESNAAGEEEIELGPDALMPTFCVDGELASGRNPSPFVNAATTQSQCGLVNVEICELGDVAYFRTTRPVLPGTELVTDYGSRYWSDFPGCKDVFEISL